MQILRSNLPMSAEQNFIQRVSFTRVTVTLYMIALLAPPLISLANTAFSGSRRRRYSRDSDNILSRGYKHFSKPLMGVAVVCQLAIASRDLANGCASKGMLPVTSLTAFFAKSLFSLGVFVLTNRLGSESSW